MTITYLNIDKDSKKNFLLVTITNRNALIEKIGSVLDRLTKYAFH